MAADIKALVHRWFEEVWNRGREEAIDELLHPDVLTLGLGLADAPVHGPAEFKVFFYNMRRSIPDIHVTVDDVIVEGDKASVRITIEGTHGGEGLGVTPTGTRVRLAGVILTQWSNGQIIRAWNSWDQLGLLQQIGAIPASGDRFLAAGS
jgi:predicted ester cyclase